MSFWLFSLFVCLSLCFLLVRAQPCAFVGLRGSCESNCSVGVRVTVSQGAAGCESSESGAFGRGACLCALLLTCAPRSQPRLLRRGRLQGQPPQRRVPRLGAPLHANAG